MARKVTCVRTLQGYNLRSELNTNVSDFTGNRTVPSMDNSNAARVPSPTSATVPYSKILE